MVIDWKPPCYRQVGSWACLGDLTLPLNSRDPHRINKNQDSFLGTQTVSRAVTQGLLLRRNLIQCSAFTVSK